MESVLRTELLEVIPKSLAEACVRHGYCTAEVIVWYITKQLILPPDVNEVTMQKEILTPLKLPPATLDQASTWLEEMENGLNLYFKMMQNAYPRTIVAFVNDIPCGVTQYYRTSGNIWDSLYSKHQLRESNITLDRVYVMLAEFLIELKMNEEQDKTTQIVTGSNGSMYDEYVNASKGKVPSKGKGKGGDGKGGKSTWRAPCKEFWRPEGCSQGHHCPKYHPRRQPGRCAICGSTCRYTSQCARPVKPKAKNVEWDNTTWQQEEVEWQESTWEIEEYEASKAKKGKGMRSKFKGSLKERVH